jgi:alkylation response protein AidB-like acyl-CoA dehydrogenase
VSVSTAEEQEELRQLVRGFLEDKCSSADVRRAIESDAPYDPVLWATMADQLGLPGIAIAEEFGGSGFGPVELGIVSEELGRALYVGPYFASVVLAAQLLTELGDPIVQKRWLPGIAAGTLTATVAITEDSGSEDLTALTTAAHKTEDGWLLDGAKSYVIDGADASLLLVVARVGDGLGIFAVQDSATGVQRERLDSVDLTRDLARIEFNAAPAIRVDAGAGVVELLDRHRDLVVTALAAEQVGGAARALDMAVEYAKLREQFGRPIGSFQAIKHKCADMLLRVESGRSAAYYAAAVVGAGGTESKIAASMAKSYCSEAYTFVAKENIQIHGGIGFTWEHDAHLFLKRAKGAEVLFGSPAEHRARIAALVGI